MIHVLKWYSIRCVDFEYFECWWTGTYLGPESLKPMLITFGWHFQLTCYTAICLIKDIDELMFFSYHLTFSYCIRLLHDAFTEPINVSKINPIPMVPSRASVYISALLMHYESYIVEWKGQHKGWTCSCLPWQTIETTCVISIMKNANTFGFFPSFSFLFCFSISIKRFKL